MDRKNIYLMYAITLLQGMVFYGSIATLYRQASGLSVFQITLIESISYALCILFEIPWGIIADKIGYKTMNDKSDNLYKTRHQPSSGIYCYRHLTEKQKRNDVLWVTVYTIQG